MDRVRNLAVRILSDVHEEGAYANVALARNLKKVELSEVDRRFLTELVYGAVKAGGTLDWMIRHYSNRPIRKVPPMIRNILRLGVYQLFYMDKVPVSAACNESVELAKKYGHPGIVKFVNAVLRAAVREPEKCAFPTGKGHATEELALRSFHPQWLVKRWMKAFGYEATRALCAFDNEDAVLSLRTNTLKVTRDELLSILASEHAEAEASRWAPRESYAMHTVRSTLWSRCSRAFSRCRTRVPCRSRMSWHLSRGNSSSIAAVRPEARRRISLRS